ncbi:MAG TPA: ribonuclease III [Phycisphaerales bacterium]|nr:ribonuclease III [Phycisphaerales bacterium]
MTLSLEPEVLDEAQRIIGYRFRDTSHLSMALTHASSSDSRLRSNERLEFLGDAVLGMIVCDALYARYPDLLEGDLTKIKSAAVSRRMCAKIAAELGIDCLLVLGKGMKTRQALPPSLSAAVLEAVVGAIYLDAGLGAAAAFLMPKLSPHIEAVAVSGHQQNYKSVLQQWGQQRMNATPIYVMLDEKGPDHAKCFEVCVDIGGRRFGSCWAASKKQAEQQAALRALEDLGLIETGDDGQAVYIGDRIAPPVTATASSADPDDDELIFDSAEMGSIDDRTA